jgi:hypothetical protein
VGSAGRGWLRRRDQLKNLNSSAGGWSLVEILQGGRAVYSNADLCSREFTISPDPSDTHTHGRLRELQPNQTDRGGRWEGAGR